MSLISTLHPTYAFFHNPWELGNFMVDLDRFARMIRGELEPGPKKINIHPNARDVAKFHKWALAHPDEGIALDIETAPERAGKEWGYTGKDPTRCKLKVIGIGNCEVALSYKWRNNGSRIERAFRALLEDDRVLKILHNGDWFDLRVLDRYALPVRSTFDTRDARRTLSSTSPLKLAYLGATYTDYHAWKEDESDEEKGLVFTKDQEKLRIYNGHDCIVTARSKRGIVQEADWKSDRVQRLYAHQRRLAEIAANMHTVGIYVDQPRRAQLAAELEQQYDQKERAVLEAVGVPNFKCSPNYIRAMIFKRHAVGKYAAFGRFNLEDPMDPAMYTDQEMDTLKVDEDALISLLIDPDVPPDLKKIIELYWDAESVWKQRSTFVTSKLISQALGRDGRLRPGWNSCGADTGRWSCKNPSVMTPPKHLRAIYTASPGNILVGADRLQFELRIMYAVTGDEALGEGIRSGNVYVAEAKDYFGLPAHLTKAPDDKSKFDPTKHIKPEAYKSTKNIRLASQYGAGKKKRFQMMLKQDLSTTWEKSTALGAMFERRNKRTVEWWEEETQRVHACGYSETRVMQRRRVYPRPPERTDTSNYPIQGTAADIKNLWMIDMYDQLNKHKMKSKLIIDLHDALYFDCPEKEAPTVQRMLEDASNVEYEIQGKKYVFPCEAESKFRWSDFS
jgi:DNA polymerase I-like protein with 3'-5' exonuclease and polymerase domains